AHLNALLPKTRGATFTVAVGPGGEVVRFEGGPAATAVVAGGAGPGSAGFLLHSLLDRDGWKELAGLTFFQPARPLRKGEKWARPAAHGWGPLGAWVGQVSYLHAGKQAGQDRFAYALELRHVPPRAGGGAMGVQLGKTDFR